MLKHTLPNGKNNVTLNKTVEATPLRSVPHLRRSLKKMDITAERAFANYLAQSDYRHPMIEWAIDRLIAGSECPSTTLLPGADYEPDDEVVRLFRRAAREEGVCLPDEGYELQWLERWICAEVVSTRMDPQIGLSALYKLWLDSQFDPRFGTWLYLSDSVALLEDGYGGLEPFHEMKLEDLDATILREARSLLKQQSEQCGGGNSAALRASPLMFCEGRLE